MAVPQYDQHDGKVVSSSSSSASVSASVSASGSETETRNSQCQKALPASLILPLASAADCVHGGAVCRQQAPSRQVQHRADRLPARPRVCVGGSQGWDGRSTRGGEQQGKARRRDQGPVHGDPRRCCEGSASFFSSSGSLYRENAKNCGAGRRNF
eukprot:2487709-Rhodomonas_salina.1